jgi:transcription-repair coupling factor (superfamily II helicase)
VEIYRRLAQATARADLDALRRELEDRFGPLPPPIELLLAIHDLRLLAADRAVGSIEVVEGKVKFTRNGQLITVGGYFPQLKRKEPKARIAEVKRLLLSLG